MPRTDPLHELLPWYATGTLDTRETDEFREHLAGCEDCRGEMAVVDELKKELEQHGTDYLADHPPVDRLIAAATGRLEESEALTVRRHLAICSACALEASWVRGEGVAAGRPAAGVTPAPTESARPSWGWIALAAAAILAVVLMMPMQAERSVTGVVTPQFILPTERGGSEPNVVELAAGSPGVQMLFEIDLPAEGFPATLEVRDDSGAVALRVAGIASSDLLGGRVLQLACSRTNCPPGDYDVSVQGSDGGPYESTFAFTVAVAEP